MSISNLDYTSYNYLSNLASVNANDVNTDILTKSDPDITDLQFDMLEGLRTNLTIQEQIDGITAELGLLGFWGAFWSTSDQTNAGATSVNYMTVNNSDPSNNQIQIGATSSQIKVLNAGVYNIQFSAQFDKTDGGKDDVSVWFLKNGVNIPDSNSIFSLEGNNDKLIAALNLMVSLDINDYIEIAWASADLDMSLHFDAAGVSPTRPQTPSVIITLQQIANNIAGPQGPQGETGNEGPVGPQGETGPQGEPGPATDGPIAIAALALATTTTATLTAYIVTNNASQAVQDGRLAALEANDTTQDANIIALQVKTTDLTWASLTKSTFSGRLNIGTTSAGVELYPTAISTFGSGISSSAAITSSAGTSQFSSLLVNTTAEVTNDFTITNGSQFITRGNLTTTKKLVLYDNTTGNDYDYLGFWTDSGAASKKFLNAEIDGVTGSAFQWYYGNNLGSARTLAKSLSSASEINYTASAKFLKSSGFSQEIHLVRDIANNIVRIDLMGDSGGVNAYDGQIIQQEGNGVDDNRGTMTIQSGSLVLNGLSAGNQIQANTSTLIQSGTTTTLTSTGETEINCSILDINATAAIGISSSAASIVIDAPAASQSITIGNSPTINLNATNTIAMTSTGSITTSAASHTITSTAGSFNVNTSGAIGLVSTGGAITLNAGTNQDVNINNCDQFLITTESLAGVNLQHNSAATSSDNMRLVSAGGYNMRIGEGSATGGLTILGVDNGNSTMRARGTTAVLNLESQTEIKIEADTSATITSANTTQINCTDLDINDLGNTTIDTTGTLYVVCSDIIDITGADINLAASDISITANGPSFGFIDLSSAEAVRITGDLRIEQNSYTQPMALDTQLGYTDIYTVTAATVTGTLAQKGSFTPPSPGVWLVICGLTTSTNSGADTSFFEAYISKTSASSTPAAPGLAYYEEDDQVVGGSGTRDRITMVGVVTVTNASTVLYLNGAGATSGANPSLAWSISYTKIG